MANLGYLQVTRRCNQHCLFCSNPEIPVDVSVEYAANALGKFADSGYEGVILTGGEPTLHPELRRLIAMTVERGLGVRMITNGQLTADRPFFEMLAGEGLTHLHVSLHSVEPGVQAALTGNPDSLHNIALTLDNASKLGLTVDINTVMCAQNADHLDRNVAWMVERFPFVSHFIWNNIDPTMNRVLENPHTVARLADLELSLHRAARLLQGSGRTFRIERLPLCFMVEFAAASTETRKIVKREERTVHFLDDKGEIVQDDFFHDKAEACESCSLKEICAGLYDLGGAYHAEELHAVFVDSAGIIEEIMGSRS